jgi:hypothetical protein
MSNLDYVLSVIDPWLDKYIAHGPGQLTPRERVGVGVWLLDVEVNNGGFHQYYDNSRGALALQTVESLAEIGAVHAAELLGAANACIPGFPLPEDRAARFALLDQASGTANFANLDSQYYLEGEDRISLLARYLRSTTQEPSPGGTP